MSPLMLSNKRQPQGPGLPMPENPFDEALAQADAMGAPQPPTVDATPPAAAPAAPAAPQAHPDPSQDLAAAGITLPNAAPQPKAHRSGDFTDREQGIHNPVLRTLAKIGDVAGSAILPGVTQFIPGTRLNEERGQAIDLGRQQKQAAIEHEEAGTAAEEAKAKGEWVPIPGVTDANGQPVEHNKTTGEFRVGAGPKVQPLKPAAEWASVPGVLDSNGNPVEINKATGEMRPATGAGKVSPVKGPQENERERDIADYLAANKLADTPANREAARDKIAQRVPAAHVAVTPPSESWQIAEGEHGQPVLYNTKTGEVKDAPTGLHAKGTAAAEKKDFEKNIAPIEAAINFADTYLQSGNFTGSDDDALMLQYFEMAKPESGFKLNTAEIKRQNQARSWRDSAEAFIRHASTGTWFSDDQRKQIVDSMHHIGDAKRTARQGGGAQGGGAQDKTGGQNSGLSVSLAAARQLPINKGKSDDEIRKDIKAHGHTVAEDGSPGNPR